MAIGVGEVHSREPETRVRDKAREPRFLQRDIVVGVEVVDAGHASALREERERGVHADESRAAGHEDGRVGRVVMAPPAGRPSPRLHRAPAAAPGVAFHGIIATEAEHARILRGFAGTFAPEPAHGDRRVSARSYH